MKNFELQINLKEYLSIIGADVITTQDSYGTKWKASLVLSTTKEVFEKDTNKDIRSTSDKIKFAPLVEEGNTPKEAIENLCEKISHERAIFYKEAKFSFPFKKLLP